MIIEVNELNKIFMKKVKKGKLKKENKNFEAVKSISFKVKRGELVAFVGPNGAGKSTTIKMLTGIIHPSSGEIKVAGLNPTKDRKK